MACSITGSGTSYPEGRIVTGSEALSIHLLNDTTDVTTAIKIPGVSNYFTIWMTIQDGGSYSVFHGVYGCWGYFIRTGLVSDTYEVQIVKNTEQAVEIILRCNSFAFGQTIQGYTSASVELWIRVEDGKQGVFLGWHSTPSMSPGPINRYNDPDNNFHEYGERELGTGSGSSVVWSSAGPEFVFRYPAWGQRAVWDDIEAQIGPISNKIAWVGHDDADYGVSALPQFAASQLSGFPNSQITAPWWTADLYNGMPICRYMVNRKQTEVGVWQFSDEQDGVLVSHFNNEWVSPYPLHNGVFPFQVFIGAFKYNYDSSNGFANEPSTTVQNEVLARVYRLEWPGEPPREWLRDTGEPLEGNAPRPFRRRRRWIY